MMEDSWVKKLADPEQFKTSEEVDQALCDEIDQYLQTLPEHKLVLVFAMAQREVLLRIGKW